MVPQIRLLVCRRHLWKEIEITSTTTYAQILFPERSLLQTKQIAPTHLEHAELEIHEQSLPGMYPKAVREHLLFQAASLSYAVRSWDRRTVPLLPGWDRSWSSKKKTSLTTSVCLPHQCQVSEMGSASQLLLCFGGPWKWQGSASNHLFTYWTSTLSFSPPSQFYPHNNPVKQVRWREWLAQRHPGSFMAEQGFEPGSPWS